MNLFNEVKARTGTAAEIAAAINSDPKYFTKIMGDKVWAWLAGDGRLLTLEQFIVPGDNDDAQLTGLKSAVKALLQALSNPLTSLDVTPNSDQRALIDSVSALLSLDVSGLIAAGRSEDWTEVTTEQVQDVLDTEKRRLEILPWLRAVNYASEAAEEESQKPEATAASVRAAMIAAFDAHANA